MNKHLAKSDFTGSALKLVAVPAPGDTATYARLAELELAAFALWRSINTYRNTPAFPINAEYRKNRMERVEADIEDMRKALGDA
jgi:hypothetical protein